MRTTIQGKPPRPHVPPAWLPARPPPRRPVAGTLGFLPARTEKIPFRPPSFPPAKYALPALSIALAGSRKCLPAGSRERSAAKYRHSPRAILPLERAPRSSIPRPRCRLALLASETVLRASAGSLQQCRRAPYAPLLRLLLSSLHLPLGGDSVPELLALLHGADLDLTKLRFGAPLHS